MSAALSLPYVWATSPAKLPSPRSTPSEPIETLAFYRKHTEALLRRYMQFSMEMGRTPSVLGNCVFRGRVSSYRFHSFEDPVIFVLDIEKCIKRLDPYAQSLIGRIALQEYSQGETAAILGQSLRSVVRRYAEAIDLLTGMFLRCGLLIVNGRKSCQGGKKW